MSADHTHAKLKENGHENRSFNLERIESWSKSTLTLPSSYVYSQITI